MLTIKDVKILRATLLSARESLTLLTDDDREYKGWWWLRSPCYGASKAPAVNSHGVAYSRGLPVHYISGYVRPALIGEFNVPNCTIGDKFVFGNLTFKIISDNLAFCLGDIGQYLFYDDLKSGRNNFDDVNDYETSDIKQFVNEWFDTTMADHIATMTEETSYPQKMLIEYKDLSEKIDDLYEFYNAQIKNKRPHLVQEDVPEIKYPISLLTKQYTAMKDYQLYLRMRLLLEGINPEELTTEEDFSF